jgi:4-amino-4-deoxy-L-arabinose transferase-like glycosyltransferase
MNETPEKQDENLNGKTAARANFFWLILLLVLTGTSIYLLVQSAGQSLFGLGLLVFALLFFWSIADDGRAPLLWLKIFERLASVSTIFLILSAILCSTAAAWLGVYLEQSYTPLGKNVAVLLWLGGGVIIFLMHCHISWETLREWWQQYRREVIIILLITLLAAVLRFYQLDTIPDVINGDEGWTGMVALGKFPLAYSIYANPFSFAEGFGRPYLDVFAAAINFLGQDKFGLRFVPALGGTFAIPAIYLLTRRLLNGRHAIVAALLLAVSHAHIHFSRTAAVGYQQGSWLAPLELYCFLKGLEDRNRKWMVMGGLLLGLHFNVYFSAQVLIPMTIVFLVMAAIITPPRIVESEEITLRHPLPIRENLRNMPWFFGSILILILPSLVWIYTHPEDFSARWAKEGSFQSGWLMDEVLNTGKPAFLILWERFVHVCQAIFILPFQDFYWAPAPVLDLVTGLLFVVGAFLALRRTRDPKILLLNGWLWSGVVAISMFAIPPAADSYRLFMVLPAMCVMAALGWAHITSLAERLAHIEHRTVVIWSVVLILLVAGLNLKTYFIDFGRSCLYGGRDFSSRRASLLGDYLRTQPAFDQAYLLTDASFSYGIFPSTDYLSGSIPMINLDAPFVLPSTHGSTLFIILPSREPERTVVSQLAPGGNSTRITDCGQLMFLAYRVYIP